MKQSVLLLLMASAAVAAIAQTPAKPAVTAPKAATTTAKPASTTSGIKLPPGVPPVHGIVKTAFSLRYQDVKIGTGADAEPGKLYKVHYTGYRAADGVKFDSSYDHPGQPERDKDGKPVLGEDGKPKVGPPQPMTFPQGMGRIIPGFDQGFGGMKVGGKRRIFIPWQLAYGTRVIPDHGAEHPGIPAKSDLIFDVELVDVAEMPAAPMRPGMGGPPGSRPGAPGGIQLKPGAPGSPATPGASTPHPGATATPAPAAAPTSAAPSTTAPAAPAPATSATPAPSAPATPAPTAPQPPK